NDYTTGYLAALGTLAALQRRAETGGSYWVRVSLARTAMWIRDLGGIRNPGTRPLSEKEIGKYSATMETAWGPVRYLRPAVTIAGTDVGWHLPPAPLGSSPAVFD
ncbi:MAG: CoA transferase, partial [Pseudomonadales bacterium]|nr:CoA transferase [Pseudomonadales bacterium]